MHWYSALWWVFWSQSSDVSIDEIDTPLRHAHSGGLESSDIGYFHAVDSEMFGLWIECINKVDVFQRRIKWTWCLPAP